VLLAKLCQLAQKVRKVSARASERASDQFPRWSPLIHSLHAHNLLPLVNSSDACTYVCVYTGRRRVESCRVMVIGCNMLLDLDAALIIPTPSQPETFPLGFWCGSCVAYAFFSRVCFWHTAKRFRFQYAAYCSQLEQRHRLWSWYH
jgi:hypothetical protein